MRIGTIVASSFLLSACGTAQPSGPTSEAVASAPRPAGSAEVLTVDLTPSAAVPSSSASAVSSGASLVALPASTSSASAVASAPACPANLRSSCTPDARCAKPGSICTCYSEMPVHCGGAAALPTPPHPPSWHCEPTDREAKREDGCPYFTPGDGVACSSEGKVCSYEHGCDYNRMVATCTKGAWKRPVGWDQPHSLPPSAASRPGPGG